MKRATKYKLTISLVILFFEMIIMPWFINIVFILRDNAADVNIWLDYGIKGIVKSWSVLPHNSLMLQGFLVFQLLFLFLIFYYIWYKDVSVGKRSGKKVGDKGGPEAAGNGEFGTSRWQTDIEKDTTAKVWYSGDEIDRAGVVLGMMKVKGREKIWYLDDDTNTLLIGAARSGKDRRIILQTIWLLAQAGESMVPTDPKGDMYAISKPFLEKRGYNVICLNFREPKKSNFWNMIELVNEAIENDDFALASEIAWDIAKRIVSSSPTDKTEPIWIQGAESTIASLILLTAMEATSINQKHISTPYYLLAELGVCDEDGNVPLCDYIGALPVKHPAKAAFSMAQMAHDKAKSSFFMSVLGYLRLFSNPSIETMFSRSDHTFKEVTEKKTAVFLVVPDESTTKNVLASIYIDHLYQSLIKIASKKGGRLPRRVNVIANEFGNLPSIPDFDTKLTAGGSRGIRFLLPVQDFQQIKKHYKETYQTITGNCHTWIYLRTAEPETAAKIVERTGKYTIATQSTSSSTQVQNAANNQSLGHGEHLTGRELLMKDEVLRWEPKKDGSLVMPISYYPAAYPLPDLGKYTANKDFGLVDPSGDEEADKKANLRIIEERWNLIPERPAVEVPIWLPEIKPKKKKQKAKEEVKKVSKEANSMSNDEFNFIK